MHFIYCFILLGNPLLIDTLSSWGPEYKVSLELKVNSFPFPGEAGGWAEVLRFTDSETVDTREPAMFTNTAGFIQINPHTGNENRTYPSVKTWHKYQMSQYLDGNKVEYCKINI